MTPTPHASHARRAAEAVAAIFLESIMSGNDPKAEYVAATIQQAIDAATADIKDQWRLSSVCREKQEEIDKLKADLDAMTKELDRLKDQRNPPWTDNPPMHPYHYYWVSRKGSSTMRVAHVIPCDAMDKMPKGSLKLSFTEGEEALKLNDFIYAGPIHYAKPLGTAP